MLALPMVGGTQTVHPDLRQFASAAKPLRPSRCASFGGCPMGIVLTMWEESGAGGRAADTGSLVHAAVKAFHTTTGAGRVAAGQAALRAARDQFPEGNEEKALGIFGSYAEDKENQKAVVPWCEQQVTLRLAPAPEDPTQEAIVIIGTLDQVRRSPDGSLHVWDVKTGEAKNEKQTLDEYAIQQAVYTLAAQQTLDASIQTGGIIYTPAYGKARAKAHLPLTLTTDTCNILLTPLVHWVALIRKGIPIFRPSADNCAWCPAKPWPKCRDLFRGIYGV